MSSESTLKTITVAALLCLVCSILVSTAAVQLKPLQEKNKVLETQRNILLSAGLLKKNTDIETAFKDIEPRLVELKSGNYEDQIPVQSYDMFRAGRDGEHKVEIPEIQDLAKIGSRARYAKVYLVKNKNQLETVILPIYGKGLWSTMYAFLAVNRDGNTIKGISFYEHGETPGLGGEVDNILWKKQWPGKKIFDENGQLAITMIKGKVDVQKPEAVHQIDGLSGATLTTVGIRNFISYWLGENGYGPFLNKLRSEGE